MKKITIIIGCILLVMVPYWVFGVPEHTEYNYFRIVNLVKPVNPFSLNKGAELRIAGTDLADYGFTWVSQYVIASPTFTLFVLGVQTEELVLGAIDLTNRNMTVVTRFTPAERKQIHIQDINFAICFLDHPYSHERLRYLFLTYIVGGAQSKTYLKVFRMENDESLTFTQMVSTTIGETDMVYANSPEAPYTYLRQGTSSEPGIQIVSRLVMADVNHDEFMDIVIWRRIYLANPRETESPAGEQNIANPPDAETLTSEQDVYEQHVFKHFTRDREEVQVMFFDWETVSFAAPITMQTESLGNDVFWRFLFPSYWAHDFFDWMESSPE